jgi:hypothetical protein
MKILKCSSIATAGAAFIALGTVISASSVQAATFTAIRIGDVDGFGYEDGAGFNAANGGTAKVNGVGVLGTGDFLPDLNGNGILASNYGDDFDNRIAAEIRNNYLTGNGFTDQGSTGSEFTDISLSTSFRRTFRDTVAHPFPGDGNPRTRSNNQPSFTFNFFVDSAEIIRGSPVYFNLVFGDYDVVPAKVLFTRADGSRFTQALTQQFSNQDGLIQAAFVPLEFSDVFTASGTGFDGFLRINFIAPNEPYTAFDFAEISTSQIAIEPEPIPEPSTTLGVLAFGALGAGSLQKRKHKANGVIRKD